MVITTAGVINVIIKLALFSDFITLLCNRIPYFSVTLTDRLCRRSDSLISYFKDQLLVWLVRYPRDQLLKVLMYAMSQSCAGIDGQMDMLQSYRKRLPELESLLVSKDATIDHLQHEVRLYWQRLSKLGPLWTTAVAMIATLNRQVREKSATLREKTIGSAQLLYLTQQQAYKITWLEHVVASLQSKRDVDIKARRFMHWQLLASRRRCRKAERENAETKTDLKSKSDEVIVLRQENKLLRDQLSEEQDITASLKTDIIDKDEALDDAMTTEHKLVQKQESLKSDLKKAEDSKETLQGDLNETESQRVHLGALLKDAKVDNKILEKRCKDSEASNAELLGRLRQSDASNAELKAEAERANLRSSKLKDQLQRSEDSKSKLGEQLQQANLSNVKLEGQLQESEARNATVVDGQAISSSSALTASATNPPSSALTAPANVEMVDRSLLIAANRKANALKTKLREEHSATLKARGQLHHANSEVARLLQLVKDLSPATTLTPTPTAIPALGTEQQGPAGLEDEEDDDSMTGIETEWSPFENSTEPNAALGAIPATDHGDGDEMDTGGPVTDMRMNGLPTPTEQQGATNAANNGQSHSLDDVDEEMGEAAPLDMDVDQADEMRLNISDRGSDIRYDVADDDSDGDFYGPDNEGASEHDAKADLDRGVYASVGPSKAAATTPSTPARVPQPASNVAPLYNPTPAFGRTPATPSGPATAAVQGETEDRTAELRRMNKETTLAKALGQPLPSPSTAPSPFSLPGLTSKPPSTPTASNHNPTPAIGASSPVTSKATSAPQPPSVPSAPLYNPAPAFGTPPTTAAKGKQPSGTSLSSPAALSREELFQGPSAQRNTPRPTELPRLHPPTSASSSSPSTSPSSAPPRAPQSSSSLSSVLSAATQVVWPVGPGKPSQPTSSSTSTQPSAPAPAKPKGSILSTLDKIRQKKSEPPKSSPLAAPSTTSSKDPQSSQTPVPAEGQAYAPKRS